MSNCRGQAYDGAATMSGRHKGVAARILSQEPRALYVHCSAHNLNLCLQDVCKNTETVKAALDFTAEVVNIVRASPKRLAEFENIKTLQSESEEGLQCQSISSMRKQSLKPLCPTRWTLRTSALQSVIDNYESLQDVLLTVAKENSEAGRKASGYASLMNNFSIIFGLKLSHLIFSAAEQANKALQRIEINCQERSTVVKSLISYLVRLREDSEFRSFYSATVKFSSNLTDTPVKPRSESDLQDMTHMRTVTIYQILKLLKIILDTPTSQH